MKRKEKDFVNSSIEHIFDVTRGEELLPFFFHNHFERIKEGDDINLQREYVLPFKHGLMKFERPSGNIPTHLLQLFPEKFDAKILKKKYGMEDDDTLARRFLFRENVVMDTIHNTKKFKREILKGISNKKYDETNFYKRKGRYINIYHKFMNKNLENFLVEHYPLDLGIQSCKWYINDEGIINRGDLARKIYDRLLELEDKFDDFYKTRKIIKAEFCTLERVMEGNIYTDNGEDVFLLKTFVDWHDSIDELGKKSKNYKVLKEAFKVRNRSVQRLPHDLLDAFGQGNTKYDRETTLSFIDDGKKWIGSLNPSELKKYV